MSISSVIGPDQIRLMLLALEEWRILDDHDVVQDGDQWTDQRCLLAGLDGWYPVTSLLGRTVRDIMAEGGDLAGIMFRRPRG